MVRSIHFSKAPTGEYTIRPVQSPRTESMLAIGIAVSTGAAVGAPVHPTHRAAIKPSSSAEQHLRLDSTIRPKSKPAAHVRVYATLVPVLQPPLIPPSSVWVNLRSSNAIFPLAYRRREPTQDQRIR